MFKKGEIIAPQLYEQKKSVNDDIILISYYKRNVTKENIFLLI